MIRTFSQHTIFRISTQSHKAELWLKPPKTQIITHQSSDVNSSFCQFRPDLEENLVDKPV